MRRTNTARKGTMKSLYTIMIEYEATPGKWFSLPSFSCMRKSFAMGAWAMYKATYNHRSQARLMRGDSIVDTCGKQTVKAT